MDLKKPVLMLQGRLNPFNLIKHLAIKKYFQSKRLFTRSYLKPVEFVICIDVKIMPGVLKNKELENTKNGLLG